MSFRILGPVEVRRNGDRLELAGTKQRALAALLILQQGHPLVLDRMIEELWGLDPPDHARKALHVHLSRLRAKLGGHLLVRTEAGYRLDVERSSIDLSRFLDLADEGRRLLADGRFDAASKRLREALALWRGAPLAGLEDEPFAQDAMRRLEELRLAAQADRIEADLACGDDPGLVAELEALVHEHPFRERLRGQLMLALYREGRQAEALAFYRQTRVFFAEELGLEPGPELLQLERSILAHEGSLRGTASNGNVSAVRNRVSPKTGAGAVVLAGALVAAAIVFAGALVAGAITLTHGTHDRGLPGVAANSVAVVDPRTSRIVADLPAGIRPGTLTAALGSVWVANRDDRTVSRLDPHALTVLRTIPVPTRPTGLAGAGGSLWVQAEQGNLSSIDPSVNQARLRARPSEIVWGHPRALLAAFGALWTTDPAGYVRRTAPATARPVSRVEVGGGPTALAAGAGSVWVSNTCDGTVTRLDPSGAVTATIATIPISHPTAIAYGARAVWVADSVDGTVVRIDPATNAVAATIGAGRVVSSVAAGDGAVWAADSAEEGLVRIDPLENRVAERIPLGAAPADLKFVEGNIWITTTARL